MKTAKHQRRHVMALRCGRMRIKAALAQLNRETTGSALVEFALCSVLFMTMTFGLIQGCFALYAYNCVSDAARWGSRYAVVRGGNCSAMPDCGITSNQMQTDLRTNVFPGINANNLTASVTWYSASTSQPTTWTVCPSQCNAPGNAVKVRVSYAFPLGIPFWQGRTLNLSSTSQMVISN